MAFDMTPFFDHEFGIWFPKAIHFFQRDTWLPVVHSGVFDDRPTRSEFLAAIDRLVDDVEYSSVSQARIYELLDLYLQSPSYDEGAFSDFIKGMYADDDVFSPSASRLNAIDLCRLSKNLRPYRSELNRCQEEIKARLANNPGDFSEYEIREDVYRGWERYVNAVTFVSATFEGYKCLGGLLWCSEAVLSCMPNSNKCLTGLLAESFRAGVKSVQGSSGAPSS